LHKLDKVLSVTRRNREKIKNGISDIDGIEFRDVPDPRGDTSICLMFFLPTPEKAQRFAEALRAENIDGPGYGTHVSYIPGKHDMHVYIYWDPLLRYSEKTCPNTLKLLGRTVHMDVSPLLTEDDIDSIVQGFHKVAKKIL